VTNVTVPQRVIDRAARTSDVPFSLFAAPAALADGEIVRLQSHVFASVGLAVVDRDAGCFRLLAPGDPPAIDRAWADARLDAAMALRVAHGLTGGDRAYRLLTGAGDRTPGVLADVYGPWAVVSALTGALVPVAELVAQGLLDRRMARGVVVKHRGRGRAAVGPANVALLGEAPPEKLVVREGAWQFEVHLTTGVNVGLFTDMRAERARIATFSAGRRVLNLFAYTGALSVAAAAGAPPTSRAWICRKGCSAGRAITSRSTVSMPRCTRRWPPMSLRTSRRRCATAGASTWCSSTRRASRRRVTRPSPSIATIRRSSAAPAICCSRAAIRREQHARLLAGRRGAGGGAGGAAAAARRAGGLPSDYPTELADVDARYLQTCLLRLL
jgi:hypothetical protein